MGKDLNRNFFKEDIQISNKCMKRWLYISNIREIQIKTTVRYHFPFIRTVIIKKTENNYW